MGLDHYKSKILFWDIETSHHLIAAFGIFDQTVSFKNILSEWFIICGSWKNLDGKVGSVSVLDDKERFTKNHKDDYHVVKKIHEVLSGVEILVGHNGDKFDLKKFNTRAIFHGFPPIPPIKTIDTLKVARKEFKFTSNKLDYIAQYLGVGQKLSTSEGLWLRVLDGDEKSIKEMVKYNKVDVVILEEVYKKFLPYIKNHPNMGVYTSLPTEECPKCLSNNLIKRGYSYTRTGKKEKFQCMDCYGHCTSRKTKPNTVVV